MVKADICHHRHHFFRGDALFCTKNAKFWTILANFGYFVANLPIFWCTLTGLNNAVVLKIDIYQVWMWFVMRNDIRYKMI